MKRTHQDTVPGGRFRSLAQFVGLLLILFGGAALMLILLEIWQLYRNPDAILGLARALSEATGVDDTLLGGSMSAPASGNQGKPLLLSYFLAWGLAVVLLSLAGRVAYLCLKGGGLLLSPYTRHRKPRSEGERDEEDEELPADYQPTHRKRRTGTPPSLASRSH